MAGEKNRFFCVCVSCNLTISVKTFVFSPITFLFQVKIIYAIFCPLRLNPPLPNADIITQPHCSSGTHP